MQLQNSVFGEESGAILTIRSSAVIRHQPDTSSKRKIIACL
jgi:hypothetical protein